MVYVIAQFFFLGMLVWLAPLWPPKIIPLIFLSLGILTGLWAIMGMGWPFNVRPQIHPSRDKLATHGLYRYVRHPMYLSVLTVAAGLLLQRVNLWSLIAFAGLVVALLMKLHFEEKQLLRKFPQYEGYMKKSKKLIPFIY